MKPRLRRELAEWAQLAHQLSQRRVAGLIPVERGTLRYQHHRDRQEALRVRLRELAGSRVRYGYRRLTILLRREGWQVNAKRIYRLYTEEGLIVRTKRRKERAQRQRVAQGLAVRPKGRWSMDFVAQRLADGRWIRVLTVVDQFTRECLCLHADTALSGEKVAAALDVIVAERGAPRSITVDNGTEFASRAIDLWAYANGVHLDFYPAWKTGGERLHRIVQREAARRVPERGGPLHPQRCAGEAGTLAPGLQPTPAPLGARRPDTGGVRIFLVGHRRASCSGASSGTRKQHFIRLFA